jgi:diguanylate cyclase (GGDEF)-like protein
LKPWWNWRDAVLGRTDPAYRKTFLQEDIHRARIVIAFVAVMVLGYIFVDYQELRLNFPFYLLAIFQTALFGASIWLFLYLPKLQNVNFTDYSIFAWSMAMVLLSLTSAISRNTVSIENININHLWVLGFYLLLPNRQPFKLIPALTISLISIYILFNYESINVQGVTKLNIIKNISIVIFMNIIGFFSSLQLESQRFHQYLIQKTLLSGREQLRELAITDSLTNILNRRGFLEMAEVEFDRFKRYGETFSFAIIDLDRLKNINDTYGHPAGDLTLQKLVEVIKQEKRFSDTTGRLAGDEFGLLLPNTRSTQNLEIMSRIKARLTNAAIELPNNQQLQFSISAGITEVKHTDKTFDDIYRRADKALLLAKDKGRNKIEEA